MQTHRLIQTKKTVCPLDCPDTCGMVATLTDGKITALTGDKAHPYTNGFICRKMRNYHHRVYSNKRILYPQRRNGPKGEGRFQRISWDEAWQLMTDTLTNVVDRYGGAAILPYMYAGNMGLINRFAGHPLFHKLGCSRLDETICSATASAAWDLHCGDLPGTPPEKAADAELIIAWGINAKVSNCHFWPYIAEARRKGAKLLVIDPYVNTTAQAADMYLPVQPAGDAALALGVIKALLEEGGLQYRFLHEKTIGFAPLKHYLESTPWTKFTEQSGVSREQIEGLSRLLQHNQRTFIRIGIGMTRNSRGGMGARAILSLAAALGLYDGSRGRGVLLTTKAYPGNIDKFTHPTLAPHLTRLVSMNQLGRAITTLQPPIHALFVYNANPLSAAPESGMIRAGLARNDLFTIVHEQVMTPTARYADLLLPATTFLENRDIYTGYGHFYLGIANPIIAPQGETISNFNLFQTLAKKLGFTDSPFNQNLDERMAYFLENLEGLPEEDTGRIPRVGEWICSTRASSSAIHHNSLGRFIFSTHSSTTPYPFPQLTPAREYDDQRMAARLPFKLITPPLVDLLNSTFGESYQETTGRLLIHPQDAAHCKITENQSVKILNDRGETIRIAHITTRVQPGLLVAEGLFWPRHNEGLAVNDLTSQELSDLGGGSTFHESRVSLVALPMKGEDA